jgi:hypothetical protein
MSPSVRPILAFLAVLTCLFVSSTAFGWVEATVLSDAVTLDVEPSGQATVAHELVMRVRGGPLKGTELAGIDFDAEPLDEATVSPASGGSRESKPLLLSRGDDDTLRIEVGDDKGLRNGTYVFNFRYKTQLRQKSRIELRGAWAQIDWIGPRYIAGMDVAKVTFRLPYTQSPPRLPEVDPSSDELSAGQLPSAAMLSNLRRNGANDELELMRPHVAKGEPVLWRIWVSPTTFPWLLAQKEAADAPRIQAIGVSRSPWRKGLPLALAGLFACAFTLLVWFKARFVTAEAQRQQVLVTPLVKLSAKWRALGTGLGVALSLLLAVRYELPTVAAVTLVVSLLLSVYREPRTSRKLRGPGRWLPIHDDEAWQKPRTALHGRWLDATTLQGKITLTSYSLIVLGLVAYYFPRQPYYALLVAMGAVAILPTLLTGCFSALPWAEEDRARLSLQGLARKLTRRTSLKVTVVGRFADGMNTPDELRLRVSSKGVQAGLLGLELASCSTSFRSKPELALLVRVRDGSPAHEAFGKAFVFGRGRTATERVTIVTFAVAAQPRLCRLLSELLSAPYTEYPLPPQTSSLLKKVIRSRSNGSVTSKPSKGGSPSQATRAA